MLGDPLRAHPAQTGLVSMAGGPRPVEENRGTEHDIESEGR
jgi:hypothetical protein